MKPHVTNLQHQKFCIIINDTINELDHLQKTDEIIICDKVTQLKNNKKDLEEIYRNYQLKLKELSVLLDEYEKARQHSRVNLRKLQVWLRFTYKRVVKN